MGDAQEFKKFSSMNYADQGKAFLNAYWNEYESEAENIWNWAHKFAELDLENKEEGCDLNEFNAHRFLESLGETRTIRQMRQEIIEADIDFNKRVALIEYTLWKFKRSLKEFVRRPQGDNQEELRKAEAMLAEVQTAFDAVAAKAEEAKQREAIAKEREAEARRAEADAITAEEAATARANELNAAVADLKAQEDAYAKKTDDLKKASETGGIVSRNRAKAQLAAHLKEDPLPLRRAKITMEAAERKAKKAKAEATASREAAAASRAKAEEATANAQQARRQAEEAVEAARAKLAEAEAYLDEIRKQPGQPFGSLWWIDRELEEKKKYLPQRKQG